MAEAIPRGLVSREKLKILPGVKCVRTNVLPANSSGNYQFAPSSNNKITFQIPSFPNSYINGKRSFIRFKVKTSANGVLLPQANYFRRMLLKNSRGSVLEDIDQYDVLTRIKANMKTKCRLQSEAVSTKDIRAVDVAKNLAKMTNATGQLVRHVPCSGIFGEEQEFLIPCSSMIASSGYCFQLELYLNENDKVVASNNASAATYSLEDVSYDMELVEVSDSIMADINSELAQGSQIPLPYVSWRSHNTALSGAGNQHKVDIAESAINMKAIYSVIVPQSVTQKQSIDSANKYLAKANDPYSFYGGRKGVSTSNAFTNETDFVTKYNWRYGSVYYPQAPIELDDDSTLALETALSSFDLRDKDRPFISTLEETSSAAEPRYETKDFILMHNFSKTDDAIDSGLNTSSSGAPVSLSLTFNANPNATVPKMVQTFIEQSNTLYIKPNGDSSLISN